MKPFVVIGNLENRRISFFTKAAVKAGYPEPRQIHYSEILKGNFNWSLIPEGVTVRLESPGENFEVEKLLILRGTNGAVSIEEDHGCVRYIPAWFEGYKSLLNEISEHLESRKVNWMNSPASIITMFDKLCCHEAFHKAGVSSTRLIGTLENYDQLRQLMDDTQVRSVFIKPRSGSSASGVIALRTAGARVSAYSSLKLNGGKLYNSLKISHYRSEVPLAAVVNLLAEQRCIVEEWHPKAKVDRDSFDLRIVTVGGRACQHVVRCSKSPMTNLHLGNRRGEFDLVEKEFGVEVWEKMKLEAEKASAAIGGHLYAGVDVMLNLRNLRPRVIEINAFGDLLPNVFHEGRSTYEEEIFSLK